MVQPAAVIAPVRVLGVEDPAAQAAITTDLAPAINHFFQMQQLQHQTAERGFSHAVQIVDGVQMRFINNGGQAHVEISLQPEPLDVIESEEDQIQELIDPPTLMEEWTVRWERVEWTNVQSGVRVINTAQPVPPPWFVDEAEARAQQIQAGPPLLTGPPRRVFAQLVTVPQPLPALQSVSPWRHVYAIFHWPIFRSQGLTREQAEAFRPSTVPFIIGRSVTGLWGLVAGAFTPGPAPFVPYPPPRILDSFPRSRRIQGLGPTLAAGNPALRESVPFLNVIFDRFELLPEPPEPP